MDILKGGDKCIYKGSRGVVGAALRRYWVAIFLYCKMTPNARINMLSAFYSTTWSLVFLETTRRGELLHLI